MPGPVMYNLFFFIPKKQKLKNKKTSHLLKGKNYHPRL